MSLSRTPVSLFKTISAIRGWRQRVFDEHGTVGFVPTMGALHDGHLSLVRRSLAKNAHTVVSVFVNPAQFAPHEDLDAYPRTLTRDLELLGSLSISGDQPPPIVFLPSVQDMYPSGIAQDTRLQKGTFVQVKGYDQEMEGRSRPTFFIGVATVVTKLFNIIQPTHAYFGQKDIQQALLLRRLCTDLHFSHPSAASLCIVPTVREQAIGLALSSRNAYLSATERPYASTLYAALLEAKHKWDAGENKRACLRAATALVERKISKEAQHCPSVILRVDYFEMNDPRNLEALDDEAMKASYEGEAILLSGAMWLGRTRLIDNIILGDQDSILGRD